MGEIELNNKLKKERLKQNVLAFFIAIEIVSISLTMFFLISNFKFYLDLINGNILF